MYKIIDENLIKLNLKPRAVDANKGSFGRLLCITGSLGMAGAAVLSARAAVKSGVGLVDVAIPKSIYNIVGSNVLEPIYTLFPENKTGSISKESIEKLIERLKLSTACLIGCGLSVNEDTEKVLRAIVENANIPLIIDADGINIISKNIDILNRERNKEIIITPHPGEMARLINKTVKEVQENRELYAKQVAKKYNITVVLKGAGTIVASPLGEFYLNTTGNPGMAKGGSGDVLAGMIASFVAQGVKPLYASAMGVYIHGAAGDLSAKKFSQTSMTPMDIIENIGNVINKIFA